MVDQKFLQKMRNLCAEDGVEMTMEEINKKANIIVKTCREEWKLPDILTDDEVLEIFYRMVQ